MSYSYIKDHLPLVSRPTRYINSETNSVKKDLSRVDLKIALAFPDTYEIGISHIGLQILYQILNMRADIACERAYAPWPDMEDILRKKRSLLTTIESGIPLQAVDILGFSLQYELSYTNILNMLDLGGLPIYARDRGENDPLVIGGGPCAFNPEPIADFFDAFVVGDGEEVVVEIADAMIAANDDRASRRERLERLSRIEGVYIPSFFDIIYNDNGTVMEIIPLRSNHKKVRRRIIPDINRVPATVRPVVPFIGAVHDRLGMEIARGCTRGCRFCQAGIIYRPVRERSPDTVLDLVEESLNNTGYDEVSLLSLSTGDYSRIEELLTRLVERLTDKRVALSLPSMRVGTLNPGLIEGIKKVRKTGFTLAPEAGTERLRKVINKGIKEEDLIETAHNAFSLGWRIIKLYFMIGLPTERDEDVDAIVRLTKRVREAGKKLGMRPTVTASVSTFIPKPHTPFQWEPQITPELLHVKHAFIRRKLKDRGLEFKWHAPEMSILEGLFSRGDRRLSSVIKRAFEKGARFDAWGEGFNFDLWKDTLREEGTDLDFYLFRRRPRDEIFPWDHIDAIVEKEFLWQECERALGIGDKSAAPAETPDCKVDSCSACGVCDFKTVKNIAFYRDRNEEPCKDTGRASPAPLQADKGPYRTSRVRLCITKIGDMRFLSHLEFKNTILRAISRTAIPVQYSEGFHPLPKVVFSPPTPVGLESIAEYIDLRLDQHLHPHEIMTRLNDTLPEGIKVLEIKEVSSSLPPLPAAIKKNRYVAFLNGSPWISGVDRSNLASKVRDFNAKDSLIIEQERKKRVRKIDIVPLVKEVSLANSRVLSFSTTHNNGGYGIKHYEATAEILGLPIEEALLIPTLKVQTVI